jgi:hypothetical protein
MVKAGLLAGSLVANSPALAQRQDLLLWIKKAYPMSAFAGTPNQSAIRHGGSFWTILASALVGLSPAGAVYTLGPPRFPIDSAPPITFLAANEFEAVAFIEDGKHGATAPSEPPARNDE